MPKVEWKGGALLAPLPAVLVSSSLPDGKPNVATVAWCGIICTQPPRVYISLRPSRFSHEIISSTREFVINLVPVSLVRAADTCGVYSGRKADKFEKCHLTPEASFKVLCPSVAESPMSLECKVYDIIPQGSHDMFLADVVSVGVSPDLIDEKGALKLDRAGLSAFAHGEYFELGRRVGTFGFSVKKKHSYKK
ncbi:MAG: flavin reductase family protein [Clostridia bacterium]|nr:flavin reductase family protein [Clostridia bacterium]